MVEWSSKIQTAKERVKTSVSVYCLFHPDLSSNFCRYFDYFSTDLIETCTDLLKFLDELCVKISLKSDNRQKSCPQAPIVKIRRIFTMEPTGTFFRIFTIEVYGENFCLSTDFDEILSQSSSKMVRRSVKISIKSVEK